MKTYTMTCSCGEKFSVEAADRAEAVSKLKSTMNGEMISKHMEEKHKREPMPTMQNVHAMVEQNTVEA